MAPNRHDWSGIAVATTITSPILLGDGVGATFTIAVATGWPTGATHGEFIATIGRGTTSEEKLLLTRSGTTCTIVARGHDGSSAIAHSSGAAIEHTIDAETLDDVQSHIFDPTQDDHTQYLKSSVLTTRGDLLVRGAAVAQRTAIGAANRVLVSDGTDPSWDQVPLAALVAAVANALHRIGDIKWQVHDTPPSADWLIADGAAVSRATYAALYALQGDSQGAGNGTTTFNLPNLVGAQLEGVATNAARAAKTADTHTHTKSGSVTSANADHTHGASTSGASAYAHQHTNGDTLSNAIGYHDHDYDATSPTNFTATTAGSNYGADHAHDIPTSDSGGVDHSHTLTTGGASSAAAHVHSDTIAYAAATTSSVTKMIPLVKVL